MKIFIDSNLLIYLNTTKEAKQRTKYETFYKDLARDNRLYTNIIALDELLYISQHRYNVPYSVTSEFIKDIVLYETEITKLDIADYLIAIDILQERKMKPSDAIHVASMKQNDIKNIASEDHEFDQIPDIKRIWIN
jgi:predicted nucleic acid-binding protein